jgi:hypothetical protein
VRYGYLDFHFLSLLDFIKPLAIADKSTLEFNEAHAPKENSFEAFGNIADTIKTEIKKSRAHWDAVGLLTSLHLSPLTYLR